MGQFSDKQAQLTEELIKVEYHICCAAHDCDSEEDCALQRIASHPRPFVTLMQ
jgi:hypothetical protein